MKKIIVVSVLLLASIVMVTAAVAQKAVTLKIGINAEITGDIPKVGEATKFAAQMWVEDVNKAGGIEVGGKKYKVELAVEDNEAKAESAAKAATKLITVDEVIAIVGPQASKQAVPAGEVCNN
jgi:branched-chain amino acid transport system substrate-binding protein